ncbi:MAG: anthranilate synthase component I family protein [Saprospiraceae bacterium]|nr:anthranilate synthase component I family protein [Saprospiraceae bacterium]
MRQTAFFPLDDLAFWKKQLLHWAAGHELAIYLDSNGHSQAGTSSPRLTTEGWECLAGASAVAVLESSAGQAFEQLSSLQDDKKTDWLFGFFGYDLKNETERLSSQHPDGIGLPDLGFFQPETLVGIRENHIEIQTIGRLPKAVFEEIKKAKPDAGSVTTEKNAEIQLTPRMSKAEYLEKVEAIRRHIVEGDLYEMNLCQEFFAENAALDPVAVFERLNTIGKAPFSTFMRWRDRYLLSASPERFLKKEGRKLISQPIKGTRKRGRSADEDNKIRQELLNSEKDRAENVMIVDLVRNDLARNCVPGSVQVEELFGIYTFETVHQMISTITGRLKSLDVIKSNFLNNPNDPNDLNYSNALNALRDAFPPGSMTGAPKVMAMELIEKYERTRRGLYSGAVGYFNPEGDFDFNVVIRSILYNAAARYVSAQVGGAIVYDSVPEEEYAECMLKAEAMMKALGNDSNSRFVGF